MNDGYHDLCQVTEAAFQAQLAQMSKLGVEEARIRAALKDLDRQIDAPLNGTDSAHMAWRAVGADQAWRKWMVRQRADLNMKLARVLARKADATAQLKLAFGRRQVSQDLLDLVRTPR